MKTLLIDDYRGIKADIVARTFDEGIKALTNDGPFDVLYLDHDLGELDQHGLEAMTFVHGNGIPVAKNGYGIMCFLEANPELLPGKIVIVSSNPVGVRNIQVVIDKLYRKESV